MEAKLNQVEPLLEKAGAYSKTSFEILKLKTLDKTAEVSSRLASRALFTLILSFFVFTISIAVALWLGEAMGKAYYGFLIVGACYGIAAVVMLALHPLIKKRVNNVLIRQLFN